MGEPGDLRITSAQARKVAAVLAAATAPVSVPELAELAGVTISTTYYTVARMRDAGWLTGTPVRHPGGQVYHRWMMTGAARGISVRLAEPEREKPGVVSRHGRRVLAFLLERAPSYGLEISVELGISHATAFGVLARFERWGWLVSRVCPPDGGRGRPPVMYEFTEAGAVAARQVCGG